MAIISIFSKEELNKYPLLDSKGDEKSLFEAIENDELIVFYGAGVSMLGGSPSWNQLAVKIANDICGNLFTPLEISVLNGIADSDPRKVISICCNKMINNKEESRFFEQIKKMLEPPDVSKFITIHERIFKLNAISYITTNIDAGIERIEAFELKNKKIFDLTDPNDIDFVSNICKGNIFYLHGSLENIERTILTTENYMNFYFRNQRDNAKQFLREVFSGRYTLLFIGYGLRDYEILQNMFISLEQEKKLNGIKKHFVLSPIYTKQITEFEIDSEYLTLYSIKTLPYFVDYEGFDKLFEILDRFKSLIDDNRKTTNDFLREVEGRL